MKEYVVKVYDNRTEWYQNNELHREDDLPAIEFSNGYKEWYQNGQCHRDNAPAIECANGNKYWYQNGKLHREDGAAIECGNGNKYWYLNGIKYCEEEFNNKNNKIKELTIKEITKLLGYEIKVVK